MDLAQQFRQLVTGLIASGFVLPIRFAAIAINGAVLAGALEVSETGVETKYVLDHCPDTGMDLPINILFSDARGEAVRVCVQSRSQGAAIVQ